MDTVCKIYGIEVESPNNLIFEEVYPKILTEIVRLYHEEAEKFKEQNIDPDAIFNQLKEALNNLWNDIQALFIPLLASIGVIDESIPRNPCGRFIFKN